MISDFCIMPSLPQSKFIIVIYDDIDPNSPKKLSANEGIKELVTLAVQSRKFS